MCIAIVKPKGIEFPNLKTLQCCFKNNPDGAGFAYNRNGYNYIYKGFFTFDDFWNKILECKLTKDDIVFIHFRLTSNGVTKAETCHPFPITDKINHLRSLYIKTKDNIVIHNGTFKNLVGYNKNITDTMNFCIEMANLKNIKNINLFNLNIEENRLAILNNDGEFHLIGNWFNVLGVYYSNKRYNIWNENTKLFNKSEYGSLDVKIDNTLVDFESNKILSKKIFACDCCHKIQQYNEEECVEYKDINENIHKLCIKCSYKKNINSSFICKKCFHIFDNKLINNICNKCSQTNQNVNIEKISKIQNQLFPSNDCECQYCHNIFNNNNFICIVKIDNMNVCINCYKKYKLINR